MKKVLFLSIALLFTVLAAPSNASAQASTFDSATFTKSISTMSDADKLAVETIKMASERMFRDFSNRFKEPSGINVNLDGKWNYISCHANGDFHRSMYNKKGRWHHTVSNYDISKLPENVRNEIEFAYPRYTIFGGVIEVNVSNKKAYLVTIEDNKSWKRIKYVDGETEVYEEYSKR